MKALVRINCIVWAVVILMYIIGGDYGAAGTVIAALVAGYSVGEYVRRAPR